MVSSIKSRADLQIGLQAHFYEPNYAEAVKVELVLPLSGSGCGAAGTGWGVGGVGGTC